MVVIVVKVLINVKIRKYFKFFFVDIRNYPTFALGNNK